MFTGIVKEIGKVSRFTSRGVVNHLEVVAPVLSKTTIASDSISVNGVCLTVVENKSQKLAFEVVKPTLEISNLKFLKKESYVNLEPALAVGDKLGGHFVLGHVDTLGILRKLRRLKDYLQIEIGYPIVYKKYLIEKGSISVEGISLTLKKVIANIFSLDIVPYTFEQTNLKYKKVGDKLNLEFDYLIKAVLSR